ncbi:MAG TPA: DUF992 domain-containing protein [Devosiaceae bacterium]|nr:DUF992 domain-containing protein [Devosiaceae bacterium]
MVKRLILASLAAAAMMVGIGHAEAAQGRVQVGRLACNVAPGIGFIIGSSKPLVCYFYRDGHRTETYHGDINKLGLDVGFTALTHIEWLVFAATHTRYTPHALAGNYAGASGEATFGVGLGANWLVGGSHRSFALQPVSVQAQAGLNLSVAFSSLALR